MIIQPIYSFISRFGIKSGICLLIAPVPVHCFSITFIEAFNSTSRYLDDFLNIDNPYLEKMVNTIYPSKLQLNYANASDTEAPFSDLHLSISNGFVSSKIMINVIILILVR